MTDRQFFQQAVLKMLPHPHYEGEKLCKVPKDIYGEITGIASELVKSSAEHEGQE